jgi:hypothetical protein
LAWLGYVCFSFSIFLVSFALFDHQVLVMYPQIEMNDHLRPSLVRVCDQKGAKKLHDSSFDALALTGSYLEQEFSNLRRLKKNIVSHIGSSI